MSKLRADSPIDSTEEWIEISVIDEPLKKAYLPIEITEAGFSKDEIPLKAEASNDFTEEGSEISINDEQLLRTSNVNLL